MILFSITFQISSEIQVSDELSKIFLQEFEEISENIDGLAIFLHNFLVTIPMFIPGFGIGWGLFISTSTGLAFSSLKQATPLLGEFPALAIFYVTPFGLMEIVAYSIAMSNSLSSLRLILKRTKWQTVFKKFILNLGIFTSLLFVGGIIEAYMLQVLMPLLP